MNAGSLRGSDDCFGLRICREPSNIFRDGARQKLDVLRKVANMLPKSFGRPLIVRRSIQANFATRGLPDSNEHPCEARFTRAARTDDSQTAASLQNKIDIASDQALAAGWRHARGFDDEALARRLNDMGSSETGNIVKSWFSARQLCRAATNPVQFAMARSTGASARALKIEPAIMMPAVAC